MIFDAKRRKSEGSLKELGKDCNIKESNVDNKHKKSKNTIFICMEMN